MDCSPCDSNTDPFHEDCVKEANGRNLDVREESPDKNVTSQCVDISSADNSTDCEITSIACNDPIDNSVTIIGDKKGEKYVKTHNKENYESTDDAVESGDVPNHCSSITILGKEQNAISSVKTELNVSSSDDSMKSELTETEMFESSETNKPTQLRSKEVKLLTKQAKVLPCSSSLISLTNCESNIILQSPRKIVKMAQVSNEKLEESQDIVLSSFKMEVSEVADNVSKVDSGERSEKESVVQNVKKSQENILDGNCEVLNSSSQTTDLSEKFTSESSLAKQLSEDVLRNSSSASKCMGPETVGKEENLGNTRNEEDTENLSSTLGEKQSEPVDITKCKMKESLNSANFPGNAISELVNVRVFDLSKMNIAENEKSISPEIKETSTDSMALEIISESKVVIKLESVNEDSVKFESEKVDDSSSLQEDKQSDELCSRSVSDSNIQSISLLTLKSQMPSNSALNFDSVDHSSVSVSIDNGPEKDQSQNGISGEYQVLESSTISASTNSQILSEVSSVTEEMRHTLKSESENSGTNGCSFHSENDDNNILCTENVSKEVPNTTSTSNILVNVSSEVSKEVDCIGMQDSCHKSSLTNENLDKSCNLENLSKLKSQTSERSLIMSEIALKSASKGKEITLQCEGNSENNVLTPDSAIEMPSNIESSKKSVEHVEESNPVTRNCSNQKTSMTEGDKAKSSDVSPTKSGASVRSVLLSEIASKSVSNSEGIDGTLPFKTDILNSKPTSPKKSCIIGTGFPRIVLREKSNKSKRGKKLSFNKKTVGDKTSTESTELVLDSKESEVASEHISGNHCPVKETSISEETIDCTETNISPRRRNFFLKNAEICLKKIKESVLTKYGINLKDLSSDDVKKNIDESARKFSPSLPVELKENSVVDLKRRGNKRKLTQSCEEEKQNVEYKPRTKKAKISRTSRKQFSSGYRKKLPLKNVSGLKYTKNCVVVNIDKGKRKINVTKNVSKTHVEEKNKSDVSNEGKMASKCNELNIKRVQIHVTKLDQNFLSKYGINLNELKMTVVGGSGEGLGKRASEGKRKEQMKTLKEPKKEETKTTMKVVESKLRRFSRNTSLLKDSPKETVPLVSNEPSENRDIKQRYKQSRKKVKSIVKNVAENKDRNIERNEHCVKETSKNTVLHVDNKETENIGFNLTDKEPTSGAVLNILSNVKENRNIDSSNCTVSETVHSNMSEQKGTVISLEGEGGTVQGSVNKLRSVRRKINKDLTEQKGKWKDKMDVSQNNAETMLEVREDSLKTFENLSSEKCLEGNSGLLQDDTRNTATVKDVALKSFDINLKSSKKTSDSKESLNLESSSKPSALLLQQGDRDVGIKVSDECLTKEIALPKDSAFNLKVAVISLSKIDNNELLKHGISVDPVFPKSNDSVGSKEVHVSKEGIVNLKSILSRRSEQLSSSEASLETKKRKRNVSFNIDKSEQECSESPPAKMFKPNLT